MGSTSNTTLLVSLIAALGVLVTLAYLPRGVLRTGERVSGSIAEVRLYGALIEVGVARVHCSKGGVEFVLPPTPFYQVSLTLTPAGYPAATKLVTFTPNLPEFMVRLTDTNGRTYRQFEASAGSAEVTPHGGRLSSILSDAEGIELLANVRWSCD